MTMTYADTARAFTDAERYNTSATGALPVSEWAEARRDTMTPQTIAANHAMHVETLAAELREALAAHEAAARANGRDDADDMTDERERVAGMEAADAARALLAAIGEDTDA